MSNETLKAGDVLLSNAGYLLLVLDSKENHANMIWLAHPKHEYIGKTHTYNNIKRYWESPSWQVL